VDDPTTFDSVIAQVAKTPEVSDEEAARAVATEPGAASMVGQVFGSYRIVSELGSGGMGWVFLAEHTMLGSHAAIKVLRAEHSQQQQVVQRFFDEARAATRVADPGIVTVLDFGWHPTGAAYLVMEHLNGETLSRRVRRAGYLPPAQALAILRQCAIAMAAAHARGIVHRDLKPDNIFIVPDPAIATERVKVLDFGIAKLLGDGAASHEGTSTGMILGTPGYMSPEQCRGAGKVDHRTDIYALGCVAFYMLCGRPPFIAQTPGDLIAAHLVHQPPAPSAVIAGMSAELDRFVLRCLAKDAAQRFQTMTELVGAIDAVAVASAMPPLQSALAIGTHPTPASRPQAPDGTRVARPVKADPATPQTAGAPVAVAASPTTLGQSVGQSIEARPSSRAGGVIAIGVAVAVAAVVVVVLARGSGDGARGAAGDGARTPADATPAMIAPGSADGSATPGADARPIAAEVSVDAAPAHADDHGGDRGKGGRTGGSRTKGNGASSAGAGSGSGNNRGSGASATTGAGSGSGNATSIGKGSAAAGKGSGSDYDPYGVR